MTERRNKIGLVSILLPLAVVGSFFLAGNEYLNYEKVWGVKIDNKLITKSQTQSQLLLNLQHEYGENFPTDLILKIHDANGKTIVEPILSIDSRVLNHSINNAGMQVKNMFLQSKSDIKVKANGRLLQSTDVTPQSLTFICTFLKYFFSLCRNLVIISTLTVSFDFWMPLLIFIETFLCLGYWTHNAHLFTTLFKDIYSCKLDIFNLIRMGISSSSDISTNSYLATYELSNKFVINCAGQLSFLIVLIFLTVLIKFLGLFLKSERLRLMNSKLKPMWNGYLFWMTPKTLSLAGFCLRLATQNPSGMQIFNFLVSGLTILMISIFFFLLIIQVRKISGKLEYIQESRLEIGLAGRLDYMKDFEFDCLQYSMLYYPAMHLGKLMLAHLCLGFAYDYHYVQYGGVIAAHVMYMMIQISSSGYRTKRDKIVYPLVDFIYVLFYLSFIGVGLIYGVGHLELTQRLETIAFSLLLTMTIILILQVAIDIIGHVRNQCESSSLKPFDSRKQLNTHSNEQETKSDEFGVTKSTDKDYIKAEEQHSQSVQSIVKQKKGTFGTKIKKVKNGKLM